MPIFEYKCKLCERVFEHLHRGAIEDKVVCPACDSDQITKQFSAFATPKGGALCPSSCKPAGGCCGDRKCLEE